MESAKQRANSQLSTVLTAEGLDRLMAAWEQVGRMSDEELGHCDLPESTIFGDKRRERHVIVQWLLDYTAATDGELAAARAQRAKYAWCEVLESERWTRIRVDRLLDRRLFEWRP